MWYIYALLSALFAALTAVLAKVGIKGVNTDLATAIRTVVILLVAWGIVFVRGGTEHLATLTRSHWLFICLSGVATGLSWIFYFKALQLGKVSQVAPVDKLSVAIA
ncbi:MAG: EamA family transporter, partial [Bacteroidota bacterium]